MEELSSSVMVVKVLLLEVLLPGVLDGIGLEAREERDELGSLSLDRGIAARFTACQAVRLAGVDGLVILVALGPVDLESTVNSDPELESSVSSVSFSVCDLGGRGRACEGSALGSGSDDDVESRATGPFPQPPRPVACCSRAFHRLISAAQLLMMLASMMCRLYAGSSGCRQRLTKSSPKTGVRA